MITGSRSNWKSLDYVCELDTSGIEVPLMRNELPHVAMMNALCS